MGKQRLQKLRQLLCWENRQDMSRLGTQVGFACGSSSHCG